MDGIMERRVRKKMSMRFWMKILIFLGLVIGTFGTYYEKQKEIRRALQSHDIKPLLQFAVADSLIKAGYVRETLKWKLNSKEDQVLRQEFLQKMILNMPQYRKMGTLFAYYTGNKRMHEFLNSCSLENIDDRAKLLEILISPFKKELNKLIMLYEENEMLYKFLATCNSKNIEYRAKLIEILISPFQENLKILFSYYQGRNRLYEFLNHCSEANVETRSKIIHTMIYLFKDNEPMLTELANLKPKNGMLNFEQTIMRKQEEISEVKNYLAIYMKKLHNVFKKDTEEKHEYHKSVFWTMKTLIKKEYDNAVFWGDLKSMEDLVEIMTEEEQWGTFLLYVNLMDHDFLRAAISRSPDLKYIQDLKQYLTTKFGTNMYFKISDFMKRLNVILNEYLKSEKQQLKQ